MRTVPRFVKTESRTIITHKIAREWQQWQTTAAIYAIDALGLQLLAVGIRLPCTSITGTIVTTVPVPANLTVSLANVIILRALVSK